MASGYDPTGDRHYVSTKNVGDLAGTPLPSSSWNNIYYRATCSCGWLGKVRETGESGCNLDGHRHLVDVGAKEKPKRRSTRPRDGRKNKVYAAERRAFTVDSPVYPSIQFAQDRLDEWADTAWFKARYKGSRIIVQSNRGGGSFARLNEIHLGKCHWNDFVLCHELAHVVNPEGRKEAAHGKAFCGVYLSLVERFISKAAADLLRAEFVAAKIPHRYNFKALFTVVTKAAESEAVKAAKRREHQRLIARAPEAAAILKACIEEGLLGTAGSTSRSAALAIARRLSSTGTPLAASSAPRSSAVSSGAR